MTSPGINRKQTLLWAGVGAAIVGVLWLLGPTLSPFMLGLVLAYIFEPLVDRLHRRGVPRTLAVVLTILLVIGLLVGLEPKVAIFLAKAETFNPFTGPVHFSGTL